MTSQDDSFTPLSPAERVFQSYSKLSTSASRLNVVSDALGKSITELDAALKKLNLGVSTWTRIRRHEEVDGEFWTDEVGYAKIKGKWGIALRSMHGYDGLEEPSGYEEWLFNDAPRALRVDAIEKIPQLLEDLVKAADDTAKRIKDKTVAAQDLASAIKQAGQK